MKTSALARLEPSGTPVESPTRPDNSDVCAKLNDGFPCADYYISGRQNFSGAYQ